MRAFCTDGLVLGSSGEILFAGGLSESMQWAECNLEVDEVSNSEDDQFDVGLNLSNSEILDDSNDF